MALKRTTQRVIYNVIIFGLLIFGLVTVFARFAHLGNVEYTDNARICRSLVPHNTKVAGFIREIRFSDYQQVKRGDTLVVIEDAEYRLHLAQAEAHLANALAGRNATHAGIATTTNNIHVSDAGIDAARVAMENAEREYARYEKLLAEGAVTRQQYDHVKTAYLSEKARYEQVTRARNSTSLVRQEQTHRLDQTDAGIRLAEAAVDLARLNLSYTVIVATVDGVTGRKDIHVGQLVQPGQPLVSLVDAGEVWVTANYRESQMKHIVPGARVEMTVDALPDKKLTGYVERISDATGAVYSIVPQDNAAGNFVKVEQRVPVRIRLDNTDEIDLQKLRSGLNVECEVLY